MLMGKFEYSVENNVHLSAQDFDTLVMLYQPLIGANAMAVYLSLNRLLTHTTYTDLVKYIGLDIEVVERSIITLEKYRLIKTFKHNTLDQYIHIVQKPLLPNELISHYIYGLELRNIIGNHQYNTLVIEFKDKYLLKENYKDISETKLFNMNQFDESIMQSVLENKESELIVSSKFNFDLFFRQVTELKFPSVLRTNENLNLIAELALFYGISEERMAVLVFRSIDYKKVIFDEDKLLDRVRREQVEVVETQNLYELPNHVFLQNLQNGAAVSTYNKELLESLSTDMKLNREVINRLVEHIMQTQDNKLVKNYILQVASTWKAFDIKNVQEANQLIEQQAHSESQKKVGINQPIIKRTEVVEETTYSAEERAKLERKWKELGEKYGKSKD